VVNSKLNFSELVPPSLMKESPDSVCLLSVYSLVRTVLCDERFIGDVETTSDHMHTIESGSCMVEIKCFVDGCLPKTKYVVYH